MFLTVEKPAGSSCGNYLWDMASSAHRSRTLSESASKTLLREAGVPMADEREVATARGRVEGEKRRANREIGRAFYERWFR